MFLQLSRSAARVLQIAAQGLAEPLPRPAEKGDLLAAIRHMGVLQIDTIHVVARSPYFVLWSRLGTYTPAWLDQLLAEGLLSEFWSHEASFLPHEDYPLYRRIMLDVRHRTIRAAHEWIAANQPMADHVLQVIRERGPVRSADFVRSDGRQGSWWDWKAEKLALETLFWRGDLMIARRERFQRVYDLRERVMPHWEDQHAPPYDEVLSMQVLRAVRALGFAPASWIADYFRTARRPSIAAAFALAAAGRLVTIAVEGFDEPVFMHPAMQPLAEQAAAGALPANRTVLLTPFDPLVWDRRRAQALFDFDYRIECYTPASRRRYGYFVLPILHHDRLVGRLDAKAHRKEGVFEVKALYFEPEVEVSDELVAGLGATLHACAAWHATPEVVVRFAEPAGAAGLIMAASNKTPTSGV
ncbi:MAG TPA: crosslink repair DNA glycosylase YcaQ family protein [Roseiflexaceae bacterium]|nr:crosslink repair DNA glycosylase YcaQ family protein [Roseiflexaceae bacterium]